uniref:DNA-directed RNA polymerase N-terminal domain-containing protein n=1 Tax=Timema monikensis TaxID=170555 RepID=A0A7R9HJ01_9NEOP|nr:unnamed protein product [Timema monikensis]
MNQNSSKLVPFLPPRLPLSPLLSQLSETAVVCLINKVGDRENKEIGFRVDNENCTGFATRENKSWSNAVLLGVGKFLYNIIMRDIKVDVNITRTNGKTQVNLKVDPVFLCLRHLLPAFYTLFRHQGHMLKEEVKPHPVLARLFRGAAQEELIFDVTNVPMLTPPLPWSSVNSGGYLLARANLIRKKTAKETKKELGGADNRKCASERRRMVEGQMKMDTFYITDLAMGWKQLIIKIT